MNLYTKHKHTDLGNILIVTKEERRWQDKLGVCDYQIQIAL